ncbi:hypothetical protein KP509_36G067000 [Ceratopteris richardii]|uniref:DUF659 domain-containing protein n=1 Tax=Ceratopteris richardii TaxID=49495 RepID=A0A8T2QDT9_CERRI|nr:hypothetical protein KP509_36G067000 [Ceratopteris richardii]
MASSSRTSGSNTKRRHATSKWTWWEEVESPVSAGEGGGARPWSCKLCGYKRTGGANKVRAHLLHERGHEVRFCSAITSEKKQELLNKLAISDAQAHARRASQAPIDPASLVRSSMPSSSRASSSSVPVRAPTPTPTPTSTPHPTPTSSTPSGMPYVRSSRQQTLHENWNPVLKEEVDTAVARFFYHDHIAFNAARSPYFKDMVKKIGEYGAHYVPPSSESLRTTLLEKEKKLVEAACETIKKSWERNGVSLLVDGWSDVQRRSIHGVVAYSRGEMYFISSHDASDTGKSADVLAADVLAAEWASAIEIVGPSNVVCIVAYGELANRVAGAIIENLYPHIIVCFCMAHCLNNILKDIGNLDWILPVINEANSLVSFINNHTRVKNEFSKRSTLALLKYSDTSGVLRGLLLSDEFARMPEASTSAGKQFRRLADDAAWWENISHIVDIVHPLPCIALKTLVNDNDRWDAYYSPLHAAAYMLDPEFQDKKQYEDPERFVPDSAARRLIRDQLSKYRTGKDASYACADAQEDRLRLQQLAIRILSQAYTTSCLEQLWSVLGVQRASDLVFVSANLRMLRRTQCMEGDLFREWEVEQGSDQVVNEEHEDAATTDCVAENESITMTPHLHSP